MKIDPDAIDRLGIGLIDHYDTFLRDTYNGDLPLIHTVIEDSSVDIWARICAKKFP